MKKRGTFDTTGVVLNVKANTGFVSFTNVDAVIEFDNCEAVVPWHVVRTVKVGDNIHVFYTPPVFWTHDMDDLEQVIIHLNSIADIVFKNDDVSLGYCEMLEWFEGAKQGYWTVEHV